MSDITPQAIHILDRFLSDFFRDGRPVRVPPAAPGFGSDENVVRATAETIIAEINPSRRIMAEISLLDKHVHLSHGWICNRWCFTYDFWKTLAAKAGLDPAGVPFVDSTTLFEWPKGMPMPENDTDPFVGYANKVLPWAVLPTVLHEVGHAFVQTTGKTRYEIEFACDEFAASYLLGTRKDKSAEIIAVGLAVWHCCLCSDSLRRAAWSDAKHPNPVARLLKMLRGFIFMESNFGNHLWGLCAAHVILVARYYDMPGLGGVVDASTTTWEKLLDDLRLCWEEQKAKEPSP